MNYILHIPVPRCPVCSAYLFSRHSGEHTYYCCTDCHSIFRFIDFGQAENEMLVTDGAKEIFEKIEKHS